MIFQQLWFCSYCQLHLSQPQWESTVVREQRKSAELCAKLPNFFLHDCEVLYLGCNLEGKSPVYVPL